MVAGILLMLHRWLAVHLVMLLVHRMMLLMLRMVMHVGSGSVFAIGGRRILGWTGMAGRFVWMHSRGWCAFRVRRMGGRWSTGCRRRSTGSIATGRWRFRSLFPTHY